MTPISKMHGLGTLFLLTAFSLMLCGAEFHYIHSGTCEVSLKVSKFALLILCFYTQNDHICEYEYLMEVYQFNQDQNNPINVTTAVQIACESSKSLTQLLSN